MNCKLLGIVGLEEALPNGQYELLHLRCRGFQTKPLTMAVDRPLTVKVKHFFMLIDSTSKCPVLALEIYIYLTLEKDCVSQHIFVPKADTTGLGSQRIDVAAVVLVLVKALVETNAGAYFKEPVAWKQSHKDNDVKAESPYATVNVLRALASKLTSDPASIHSLPYYGTPEHKEKESRGPEVADTVTTKISLFTRAANAYIFPKLEHNSGKHIADGNTLFRWWLRIFDHCLPSTWRCVGDIPGAEAAAVARSFPSDRWKQGNIYVSGLTPAVRQIPLFPDDPKGRFLEHLIVEGRYKSVTTQQFWQELGFRQEFRLGNVVGIIGCENSDAVALDRESTCPGLSVSHKQYKKVVEFVKGEDYSNKFDIQAMIESGLPEVFKQNGLKYLTIKLEGKRQRKEMSPKNVTPVNNLNSMVRKRPAVNNLTGLVKKAPKTSKPSTGS